MRNDTDVLLGSAEAADLLGVHRSFLQREVRAGRLAPVHRGSGPRGAMLFSRSDIEALAASRRALHSSPMVETPDASSRGGDVEDAVGARSDTGRVALPRPVSEPFTRTSGAGAASLRAGVGLHH